MSTKQFLPLSDSDSKCKSKRGFRLRYEFWLNIDKPSQFELSETIDSLKEKRKFAPTIRNGIKLVTELRQGITTTLFNLFPQLREQLKAQFRDEILAEHRANDLDNALATLQTMLTSGTLPAPPPSMPKKKLGFEVDEGPPPALTAEQVDDIFASMSLDNF